MFSAPCDQYIHGHTTRYIYIYTFFLEIGSMMFIHRIFSPLMCRMSHQFFSTIMYTNTPLFPIKSTYRTSLNYSRIACKSTLDDISSSTDVDIPIVDTSSGKASKRQRLDEACLQIHPEYSRNVIQSWIAQGIPYLMLNHRHHLYTHEHRQMHCRQSIGQ